MVVNWLVGAGFIAITFVAVAVLLSDPYKRRKDSGGDGGGTWLGGDGGDCGGGDGGGGD